MTDSNRSMFLNVMLVLLAYLLGSVSSAVVVCKVMGLSDPRSHGSKNPGATNVLRLHGKKAATLTLTGDVLKGFVPVFVVYLLNAPLPVLGLAALAAFCGHLFPVFFRFKGGKGVATLIGVLFGINAFLGLAFVVTWLIVALLFRYSSLAGLTASALAPVYCGLLNPTPYLVIPVSIMAVILFWRHRSNIRNLLSGTEDKIGEKNG
ncbi:MAG TPA: glycerol-3-phosphate 1-O-acyltransferase PlsY [Gammaproteobacteria bacterium]